MRPVSEAALRITVVAAWPHEADLHTVLLPPGATVADALAASGMGPAPGGGVAVFGVKCAATQVLRDGDRIEVLRPLQVDPKEARRKRAEARQPRRR